MRSRIHAAGALLALFASASFSVPAAETPAPSAPVAGIVAPNVRVISPLLVTAGQPDRASLQRLKAEGYAAVISLAPGNTSDAVPDQAEILKAQGLEFVHCQMNMRASAITFLYRTIYEKADPAKAWGDVKALWTPTDPWSGFIDAQLRTHGIAFQAR